MKIAIAQTCPSIGDMNNNFEIHKKMIQLAGEKSANFIVFPELSLTGYEPKLASELAMDPDHPMFLDFQQLSDSNSISIGVGVPIRTEKGVCIAMVILQPGKEKQFYFKNFLHPDEKEFFVTGKNFPFFEVNKTKVALAICFEISVSDHIHAAFAQTPDIFVASVVKSKKGIQKARTSFSEIVKTYHVPVAMSNSVGFEDGQQSNGLSSVWNKNGNLLAQLDQDKEGIVFFDIDTEEIEILKF